jgi:hypothetical protein
MIIYKITKQVLKKNILLQGRSSDKFTEKDQIKTNLRDDGWE